MKELWTEENYDIQCWVEFTLFVLSFYPDEGGCFLFFFL